MELTLSSVVAWLFGLGLTLFGLLMMIIAPVGGLILVLTGVFALPIVRRKLREKTDVSFSKWLVAGIVIVGFLGGFVVVGISALSGSDATGEAEGSNPSQQQAATTETREFNHSVGDTFTVGDGARIVEYTVTDARTTDTIGSGFSTEEADGVFVVVEVRMTNRGDESLDMSSSNFRLVDDQARSYETDRDAVFAVEDNVIYEQLDPGVTKRGVLVFDVPPEQSGRELEIRPAGIFSTAEEHYVDLEL